MNLLLIYIVAIFQWLNPEETKNKAFQPQQPIQSRIKLNYIKNPRIKIDGGGNYYTYDTTSLDKKKHIFVISASKTSFISLMNQSEYIYMERSTKEDLTDGFIKEKFQGDGYTAILKTKRVKSINDYSSLHEGTLIISNQKASTSFKVHGIVE
ncbi:hypothetical protein [Pontibacter akesuensis]|uniref:Uncharacterized protein n=1 Tax=Pontibacter akesuensis TaxID=388950 RepID=A0A1I7IHI5_9BACT|nr:hypothetical protein [Pontibacter akesuensis]GHA67188.1 hypothetical protein GCM10007389_20410 [Pontibacter akesuensis]SFU72346.1 hypothetical protein SAMN04487941_2213 [Pontibacter akesuensis]